MLPVMLRSKRAAVDTVGRRVCAQATALRSWHVGVSLGVGGTASWVGGATGGACARVCQDMPTAAPV
jgi:hypothetical protein